MERLSQSSRWLVIFSLVAALSIGIAACGDDGNNSEDSNNTSKQSYNNGGNAQSDPNANPDSNSSSSDTGSNLTSGSTTANDSSSSEGVAGGRFFAANSPWNTEVDGLPIDPSSARMLDLAGERRAVREAKGQKGIETIVRRVTKGLYVNTEAWSPLIVEAGGNGAELTKFVCRQSKCGSTDPDVPDELSIPSNTTPDPRYDGWLSVIDTEAGMGYDFWRARRQSDNSISFQYSKAWTLDGPGFSKPISEDPQRAPGARGSGLPLFAGVIGSEEASQGRINHALAIAVPGIARRNYVQPASVTDGVGNGRSLPAGARIRLRANVTAEDRDLADNNHDGKPDVLLSGARRRSAESILVALRQYGAIVVDRSAVPTLYAPRGTSAQIIAGPELSWLTLDDFEVVGLPEVFQDPPLGDVALEGPTGSSVDETSGGTQADGQD
ncbi:MAG: hypothetical protein JJE13_09930 [Thermoleophilia bacterium]|nr:hypothetical protein [Thermoleophilia bacterium]